MSATFSPFRILAPAALLVVVFLLAALLVRQQEASKRMEEQNRELQEKLEAVSRELTAAQTKPAVVESAPAEPIAASPEVAESTAAPAPVAPVLPAPTPRIDLENSALTVTDNGLRATLTFKPENDLPLGEMFVVVRLPEGEGRITDIQLAEPGAYKDYYNRISEDGRFAAFRAQAGSMSEVKLWVEVSGAAVLDMRGTCGVGPFDLSVTPEGVSVTPK